MSLDPQIAPIVDAVNAAAADAPPLASQTVEDRRQAYLALSALAGAGPELDSVVDDTIAGVPVRRYANADAEGVFIYIHGGGYTIGDLNSHDEVCRQLAAQSGATVISVDYALAPERPFPAGVNDCWNVVQAVHEERSGSTSRIVVGGDSAGGNLSAVVALLARDAGIELAAQLLVYPAVDVEDDSPSMTDNAEGYVLTRQTMEWFNEQYAPDPADWRASPINNPDLSGVAPALVITAQYDPLRDQGVRYVDALRSAGVDVTHTNYDAMVHIFFQLGPIVDAGATAVSEVAQAARSALRG